MLCTVLTEAQHELRRTGITATDIGAILGLNPYKRAIDVQAHKLGVGADEFEGNERTKWGLLLELPILREYCKRTGARHFIHEPGTIVHPEFSWALATPDAYIVRDDETHGAEVKTALDRFGDGDWGDEGTDHVPDYYRTQVIWNMFVADMERWDVPALINYELKIYRLNRDRDLEAAVVEKMEAWWKRHVVNEGPIDPDGSDQYDGWLRRRFKNHDDEIVTADPGIVENIETLAQLRKLGDANNAARKVVEQNIKRAIGGAAGIDSPLGRITWKRTKDRLVTDWKAAFATLAGVAGPEAARTAIDEHTKAKDGHRVFLVPRDWKESK